MAGPVFTPQMIYLVVGSGDVVAAWRWRARIPRDLEPIPEAACGARGAGRGMRGAGCGRGARAGCRATNAVDLIRNISRYFL